MTEGKAIVSYEKPDLNKRLQDEKKDLERYFYPNKYPILHKNDEPCFEHEVVLNGDRNYKLRVYVNEGYPDTLPDLVVCESPEPMPPWVGSHDTHTWQPKHGFLQICHWRWAGWTRKYMVLHVFDKGKEWLEAYEKYLQNGKLPLDLEDMELTEEEKLKEQQLFMEIQRNVQFQEITRLQYAQIQQFILFQRLAALEICQPHPNIFFKVMHRRHMHAIENILSQQNLPIFPINIHDIMKAQEQLEVSVIERIRKEPDRITLFELFKLQCLYTQRKIENPMCDVNISITQKPNGQIEVNITVTGPRSLQNN